MILMNAASCASSQKSSNTDEIPDSRRSYRYFAAAMNWLKASYQTMTLLYAPGSMDAGTDKQQLEPMLEALAELPEELDGLSWEFISYGRNSRFRRDSSARKVATVLSRAI
jgi:hypothetical protein